LQVHGAGNRFRRLDGTLALGLLVLASGCGQGTITGPPVEAGVGGTTMTTTGGASGSSSGSSGKATGGSGGSVTTGGSGGSGGTGGGSGGSGGTGGSTAGSAGNGGSAGGDPPPVGGELSDCATPGPRLIRRLTSIQFRNTLVDAFGDAGLPSADVLTDPTVLRFRVDADVPVIRDLDAGLVMNYAETVAAWAVANKLGALSSCTSNDAGCRGTLIRSLGLKLFREPLTEAQVASYEALGAAEATFQDAATQIIATMLQSPYLLYRRELGTPSGGDASRYDLGPYEIASELSYFLTDSAPDAELLRAAEDRSLLTAAGIDAQAQRLLFTPAAKATVARFASGWFELDGLTTKAKDDAVFPLGADLRQAMIGEAQEFFASKFANGGDVTSLLTSTTTFVNQALGSFYGLNGASGTSFTEVSLAGSQRAPGMLGQGAFLAVHAQPENSSPVQRGRFVRERLLCQEIPEMPSDLDTNLASGESFKTNRERYAMHSANSACVGCHQLFDPVGFTFEHFDGFGRYRDNEKGTPIDATGVLYGEPTGDIALDGVESLVDYLATSDQVRACVVRYWSYFAHGRDNWQEKKCNDDAIRREAAASGYTLHSVFSAILHAQSFSHRVKDQ
jgi:hypothetical protein